MSLENIKNNFEIYLKNIKNDKDDQKYSEIQDANFDIFDYATEFKDFVDSEYIFSNAVDSENIDDILKMEMLNGKLTTHEELEEITKGIQDSENKSNIEKIFKFDIADLPMNKKEITDSENTVITDLLKELVQNEEFINALDSDNNNVLSTEELQVFIKNANKLDSDTKNLSIQDIINGIATIAEGKNLKEVANAIAKERQEAKQDSTQKTTNNTQSTSTTISNIQTSQKSTVEEIAKGVGEGVKIITNTVELSRMTKAELSAEKETATNNLNEKESNLTSIIDGSNPILKTLNKKVENIYKIYQEQLSAVNEEMAKEVDSLKSSIEEQDAQICANEVSITQKETEIRNTKSSYTEQQTRKSAYKTQLANLSGKYAKATDDESKAEISRLMSNLKEKIAKAEENENNFKTTLEKKRAEVADLKEKNEALKQSKTELETQLSEKEAEINKKYPEISKYLNYYNEAKNYYAEQKAELTETARAELKSAQTYLNQVKTAFSKAYADEVIENNEAKEYNAEAGNKLTANAKQVEAEMSGTGLCLKAVKTTLKRTYPEYEKLISETKGYGSAYQFAKALSGEDEQFADFAKNFKEIECSTDDIGELPAGAIVVYSANSSKPHGHIAIMDGEGNQYSDWTKSQAEMSNYYQREFWNKGSTIRVFVPTQ